MTKYDTESGFSLVELSVVIVVIGLMLAGTLVGVSLLRSAGVKAVLAESNDFKAGMRQFEALYNGLPGDLRNADGYWTGATNGDGNHRIDTDAESVNAVTHLVNAELISGNYTGTWDMSGYILGGNTVRSHLDKEAALRMFCCSATDYARTLNFKNFIEFFSIAPGDVTQRQGVLTPIEAMGIDQKVDDGKPDNGFVGAQGSWNGSAYTEVGCYSGSGDSSAYLSTDSAFKNRRDGCQIMFAYDW